MTRWLAGVAVAAAAAFGPAAPAPADPVCAGVDLVTNAGHPVTLGPVCVPYPGATNCRSTEIGVVPTVVVLLYTCTPR
jgi:hypothetical protein